MALYTHRHFGHPSACLPCSWRTLGGQRRDRLKWSEFQPIHKLSRLAGFSVNNKEKFMKAACGVALTRLVAHYVVTVVVSVLVGAGALTASIAPASADSLSWKLGYHLVKAETAEVGDVPGHVLVQAKASGVAFFAAGEVAAVSLSIAADYINGAGPHEGYLVYVFDDGSNFVVKMEGVTTPDPATKTSGIKGKFKFTQGSGRFSGISGSGDYFGKRLAAAPAAGSEIVAEFSGTYSR